MWKVILKYYFQFSGSLKSLCVDCNCINKITGNCLLSLPQATRNLILYIIGLKCGLSVTGLVRYVTALLHCMSQFLDFLLDKMLDCGRV